MGHQANIKFEFEKFKECSECHKVLSSDRFVVKKGRPGHKSRLNCKCKDCVNKAARKRYKQRSNSVPKPALKATMKQNHKRCTCCKVIKKFIEFHPCCKNPTKGWHYDSKCKDCKKKDPRRSRKNYKRPSEDLIEYKIMKPKWKNVKDGKRKVCGRNSGGNRLIDFTIKIADVRNLIKDGLVCASTNTKLSHTAGPLFPSLDRIDCSKGYTPNNIRVVSLLYNFGRNVFDDIDTHAAIHGLLRPTNQNWDRWINTTMGRKTYRANKNPGSNRKYAIDITKHTLRKLISSQTNAGVLECSLTGAGLICNPAHPLYPSLDRIDNSRGYIEGNVRITSKFANLAKWQWHDNVFLEALEEIKRSSTYRGLYFVNGLRFFKDEIKNKRDICNTIIQNSLNTNHFSSVRPQKCTIKLIDNRLAASFYDKYHYMGGVSSSFNIAATLNNDILACVSIRRPSGINSKDDWEISRMASHAAYRVHGVWSYLMKWIKKNKFVSGSLITFSDNRIFGGSVCSKMGLKLIKEIPSAHYWAQNDVRCHRQTPRNKPKNMTGGEWMKLQGYTKVWDIGKKKWGTVI